MSKKLVIIALSVFSLVGCNSEGDSSGTGDIGDLAGIYDWSDDHGNGIIDEWYIGIDKDGYVSDYDYQGDSYDQGDNCYYIDSNWDRFTHISGNRFNSEEGGDFTLVETNDGLTLEFDDPDVGSVYIGPKTDLNKSDLMAADCNATRTSSRDLQEDRTPYEKSK